MVERYDFFNEIGPDVCYVTNMVKSVEGRFVLYEDYIKLEKKLQDMIKVINLD